MSLKINGIYTGEIQPTKTVAGCINIYENVFPNPDQAIDIVESACANDELLVSWRRSETIGDGVLQNYRTNLCCDLTYYAEVEDFQPFQGIHNQCLISTKSALTPYMKKYNIDFGLQDEGFQMLRYSEGEQYKIHSDYGPSHPRIVSAIIYLNDDFEGGEIEFPYHEIRIKPKAGAMLLFPSNYAYSHSSLPVTSGEKYAIVTWFNI